MRNLILAAFVFISDQASKRIVELKVKPLQTISIIKNKFQITNVKNEGAAYGILKNKPKLLNFLSVCSIVSVLTLFVTLIKHSKNSNIFKVCLALTMGGGLSNIYDRIKRGYVTDFIHIKPGPVFNIADVAVALGAIIFGFSVLFLKALDIEQ